MYQYRTGIAYHTPRAQFANALQFTPVSTLCRSWWGIWLRLAEEVTSQINNRAPKLLSIPGYYYRAMGFSWVIGLLIFLVLLIPHLRHPRSDCTITIDYP